MEMSWYFSSLRKPLSLVCCTLFRVNRLLLFHFIYKMLVYIRWRAYSEMQYGKKTISGWFGGKKLSFSCFNYPGRLMNSQFYQCAGLAGSPPPHSSSPASTFRNEMWEMGQFTAKGCFFLRDIKMENRWYAVVDVERRGVLSLDREKKGRRRCETGKQDVGVNMSVISEGRRKCLNCIFSL